MAILPIPLARVSNLLSTGVVQQSIQRNQQQLLEVQNEISTGKRVNVPSDDPGAAAIIQQLQKTLASRDAYATNLKQAASQLGAVDSNLSNVSDLLLQAQNIASANVGSDVTPTQRAAAAQVIASLQSQMLSLGNEEQAGMYLYGGDRCTAPPFQTTPSGIKFVGSATVLSNTVDENTKLAFQANGADVFGAVSSQVKGSVDLTPAISLTTRLTDLRGAHGDGVSKGSIRISSGGTSSIVDISAADSVGDVVDAINNAAVPGVTASLSGGHLVLSAGGGTSVSVSEVGGGTTAADLGIVTNGGTAPGAGVTGQDLQPAVTPLTKLSDLRGGAGIDVTHGLKITNGGTSATIDLTSANTVEDLLNAVNSSGTGVLARINAAGNGIDIVNPSQGSAMTISENGGTTAADLGVRSLTANTSLSDLNGGLGVRTQPAGDFRITRTDGTTFDVSLSSAKTIGDVIAAINTASGGTVTASLATTGNGIILSDSAGGGGTLSVASLNASTAAADLGLTTPGSGNTITGTDPNPIANTGIFANLQKLHDALTASDQQAITAAAAGLKTDYDRVTQIRGQTGARVQEIQARQSQMEDQNVATKSFMSSLQDADMTQTITQFQAIQTALQASLQSAGRVLNLSLMDFLGTG